MHPDADLENLRTTLLRVPSLLPHAVRTPCDLSNAACYPVSRFPPQTVSEPLLHCRPPRGALVSHQRQVFRRPDGPQCKEPFDAEDPAEDNAVGVSGAPALHALFN